MTDPDLERGYGARIWSADMERGYGARIWSADMERGYGARIWSADMEPLADGGVLIGFAGATADICTFTNENVTLESLPANRAGQHGVIRSGANLTRTV